VKVDHEMKVKDRNEGIIEKGYEREKFKFSNVNIVLKIQDAICTIFGDREHQ